MWLIILVICEGKRTRKASGTAENPARQQILFCVQIKVVYTAGKYMFTYISLTTQNLSDLDLSRTLKVICDRGIGLLIYGFLLML